jgi:hypothetical protein
MIKRVLPLLCGCVLYGIGGITAGAQTLLYFDFESGTASSNQFTQNFRLISTGTGSTGQSDPTANEPGNDFVSYERTGGTASVGSVLLYDTTPANTGDTAQVFSGPLSISLDLAAVNATSGAGIYLVDPTNVDNNIGIFAQISASSTNERLGYRLDADLDGGTTGTETAGYTGDSASLSAHANPVFTTLTLTYTPGATSDTLVASFGSLVAAEYVLTGAERLGSETFMLALRLNDTSNTTSTSVKIDNLTVSVVPEPSGWALLLGATGLLGLLRRRRA